MAALQDAGQSELIEWVKEVCLTMCLPVLHRKAPERVLTNGGVK
jgi:hypothetical protein